MSQINNFYFGAKPNNPPMRLCNYYGNNQNQNQNRNRNKKGYQRNNNQNRGFRNNSYNSNYQPRNQFDQQIIPYQPHQIAMNPTMATYTYPSQGNQAFNMSHLQGIISAVTPQPHPSIITYTEIKIKY